MKRPKNSPDHNARVHGQRAYHERGTSKPLTYQLVLVHAQYVSDILIRSRDYDAACFFINTVAFVGFTMSIVIRRAICKNSIERYRKERVRRGVHAVVSADERTCHA